MKEEIVKAHGKRVNRIEQMDVILSESGSQAMSSVHIEIDKLAFREACKRRGYIEYKKGVMRAVEDFLDDEMLEFVEGKPYKDFY